MLAHVGTVVIGPLEHHGLAFEIGERNGPVVAVGEREGRRRFANAGLRGRIGDGGSESNVEGDGGRAAKADGEHGASRNKLHGVTPWLWLAERRAVEPPPDRTRQLRAARPA